VPQNRSTRRLTQAKQKGINLKEKSPLGAQGHLGDLTIRKISSGVFLFFKAVNKWFQLFNSSNHMIPDKDAIYDIGSQDLRWRSLFVSGKSLHIGDTKANSVSLGTSGTGTSSKLTMTPKGGSEVTLGAVTALNDATESELVTVGTTTTELDAESNLTFNGSTLAVTGSTTIVQTTTTGVSTPITLFVDTNTSGVAAQDSVGLHLEFVRTVAASGTAAHNDIGINLDVTSASKGTSTVKGMDIDVIGAATGTQDAIGIDLDVDTAGNSNIGMLINTAGTHIKLEPNADVGDYTTISVADTGDLTIATNDNAATAAHIILDADGDIRLDADGGDVFLQDNGALNVAVKFDLANKTQTIYKTANDYFEITVAAAGATTIATTDSTGAVGHLTLDADGDIILDADGGNITLQDGGSTYAPTAASDATTKAYVDAHLTPAAWSSTLIKVMPTEWRLNDDYGRVPNVVEDDTSGYLGFRVNSTAEEAYAFVPIPDGYKATYVEVHASDSDADAAECFSFNYTTGAVASLASGTFDLNTNENITDLVASATNDLVIKYKGAVVATIVYGATVTIVAV